MRELGGDGAFRPSFSGHETFPLRLLWLKKVHDAVGRGASPRLFSEPDAIARFGVGRNMALSMQFWAEAAGTIALDKDKISATEFGALLLNNNGLDPYLESQASIWTLHFHIASDPRRTTPYFVFNGLAAPEFDSAGLQRDLEAVARAAPSTRASATTIKRDIEVLLRSYVSRRAEGGEDAAEPLFAELGLIREKRAGSHYELVRGPKPTLPDGVFAYALSRFWEERHGESPALTVDQVCFGPGSPGRVFKLDEHSVAIRLQAMEQVTAGKWRWTETAGLRQIQRVGNTQPFELLRYDFPGTQQ
ncbi:MAG TPA: DUF4007 family protein [Sphingomicrobium sp.]|nr:DUF4007 family protein [Sphingomicrobium sp.]